MRLRRNIRVHQPGLNVDADIQTVVSINQGEDGQTTEVHSYSDAGVHQDTRRKAESPGTPKPRGATAKPAPEHSDKTGGPTPDPTGTEDPEPGKEMPDG
jgi:hypothetical protein